MATASVNDLAGHTILIVDDNPANLGVVADYLEYAFTIFTAMDGADALETAATIMPDLILLDVMMPGIDGFEVCQRLKADPKTQDIPIIFMTALASTDDKIKGFTVGAVDYVTKPIHQEELLMRIRTHLTIQNQKAHLRAANAALERRAAQLEIGSQVAQQVAAILDVDTLLTEMVQLVQQRFNYYCVGVWLLNEKQDHIVLRAFASQKEDLQFMLGFTTALDAEPSILAHAGRAQSPYLANQVRSDPHYFFWEALPETRAELVLPLNYGQAEHAEHRFLGLLDIQSDQADSFTPEDVTALHMLANQIAVALRNAQMYTEITQLQDSQQRKK